MNQIFSIKDVPKTWIYRFYSAKYNRQFNQLMDGRTIKLLSFWTDEKTPSLCIYFDVSSEEYKWHDYSSNRRGDAIRFVQELENKNFVHATQSIISEYEAYVMLRGQAEDPSVDTFVNNSLQVYVQDREYRVSDIDFWSKWRITLKTLNRYHVHPFSRLEIVRGNQKYDFSSNYGFVYRKGDGTPYQVYQPNNSRAKYLSLNLDNYMIGEDQLSGKKVCGILSGLKDILAITELELQCDYVASKSESIILSYDDITFLKANYDYIFAMLDNDAIGIKYMKLYNSLYDIPYIITGLSKDIALDKEVYNDRELVEFYTKAINSKINVW